MVTKSHAKNAKVDWEKVAQLTEIPRSYEILLESGGIIFKMYKPSELKKLKSEKNNKHLKTWKRVKLVGKAV